MTSWNYNMDEAPKGTYEKVVRTFKGQEVTYDRHIPTLVIAAGNDGVVTVSRWLPEEERWNMFTKNVPPFAWYPWPEHPLKGTPDDEARSDV